MSNVCFVHNDLNEKSIELQHPKGVKGGAYISQITNKSELFYLQLPKCTTRGGIVKTEKKVYCDLLFDKEDEFVISWFESLQNTIQQRIFSKKNTWFNGEIEMSDIEDSFSNILRTYRSGQNILIRCLLPKDLNSVTCYDDNNNTKLLDDIIAEETDLIPLVEIANLRFTSRNFQVDIILREIMIVTESDEESDEDDSELDEDLDEETDNSDFDDESDDDNDNDDSDNLDNLSTEMTINSAIENQDTIISDTIEKNTDDINNKTKPTLLLNKNESPLLLDQVESIDSTLNIPVETITSVSSEEKSTIKTTENIHQSKETKETEKTKEINHPVKTNNSVENGKENESIGIPLNLTKKVNIDADLNKIEKTTNDNDLEEVSIDLESLDKNNSLSLKSPQNVYYSIWKNAKERLKFHRNEALKAYLEAMEIKNTYLVDEIDNDSEEDFTL